MSKAQSGRKSNTYEAPGCQGRNSPSERIFLFFFRLLTPGAGVPWQRVLASFPSAGTPPWLHHTLSEVRSPCKRRLQRPRSWLSATSKRLGALLPSYATARSNGEPWSSEVQARGRSSTRQPVTTLAIGAGAGGGVSSKGWRRARALDAQRRSPTQALMHERALHVSGSSHRCPVRRQAHRLPSLSHSRSVA